jgi:hypothetical protein
MEVPQTSYTEKFNVTEKEGEIEDIKFPLLKEFLTSFLNKNPSEMKIDMVFFGGDMLFDSEEGILQHRGQLTYVLGDYAFDFLPHQTANGTVLIRDIQMSFIIDSEGRKSATQIWGYHPFHLIYRKKELCIPNFVTGNLIILDETLEEGDIIRLEGSEEWYTCYDSSTGWLCVGDEILNKDDIAVEFATNIIAVLRHKQLISLWLKPTIHEEIF